MNRGPAPKTARILAIKRGKKAPAARRGRTKRIDPPAGVEFSPAERRIWDSVLAELKAAGTVARADAVALSTLVHIISEYQHARARMVEAEGLDGLLGDTAREGPNAKTKSAWCRVVEARRQELDRWLASFGLTPASRERAASVQDDLFNGKGRTFGTL